MTGVTIFSASNQAIWSPHFTIRLNPSVLSCQGFSLTLRIVRSEEHFLWDFRANYGEYPGTT